MDLGMITGLISAGSGLLKGIGGLFGNKGLSQRKAAKLEKEMAEDLRRSNNIYGPSEAVEGYRRAGLNPSAMMAGGGAGFATASSPIIGPATQDTSWDSAASGLATIADGLAGMQPVGPEDKKRKELENKLLEKRLEVLNAGLQTSKQPEPGLMPLPSMEEESLPLFIRAHDPRPGYEARGWIPNPKGPDLDQAGFMIGVPGGWDIAEGLKPGFDRDSPRERNAGKPKGKPDPERFLFKWNKNDGSPLSGITDMF